MPKHHHPNRCGREAQPARASGGQGGRQQPQQQPRFKPPKVAQQPMPPQDLSPDDSTESSRLVPVGKNLDALLQESAYRQLGQKLPAQLQSQASIPQTASQDSASISDILWPRLDLLGAAIACVPLRQLWPELVREERAACVPAGMQSAMSTYLQLLGLESLPCLPEGGPESVDAEGTDADVNTDASKIFGDVDVEVDRGDCWIIAASLQFDWLDVDSSSQVLPQQLHGLQLTLPQEVTAASEAVKAIAVAPELLLSTTMPKEHLPEPLQLPPPQPPLPLPPEAVMHLQLPDMRQTVRRTRDLAELDKDLDQLLQD